MQILWAHLQDEPPDLAEKRPEVPKDVSWAVLRGLEKEADKRPPSPIGLHADGPGGGRSAAVEPEGRLMEAKFIEEKPMAGREVAVIARAWWSGRTGSDIELADPEVSRRHATFRDGRRRASRSRTSARATAPS